MESGGLLDFRNAPVSKLLVLVVACCSALTEFLDGKVHASNILAQLWEMFITQWAFRGIGTIFVGTWLFYKMRIVERRYGSSKYISMVFNSVIASFAMQFMVKITGSKFDLASGPYAVLFSIIFQYQNIVPPSYTVDMLGTTMSDKTYVFLTAVQLLLSNSVLSAIPCFYGFIIGSSYENISALQQWRFPKSITNLISKYTKSNKKKSSRTPTNPTPIASTSAQAPLSPPSVDEEDINTMLAMFPDYPRETIRNALASSNSDLNRAAEILLSTEQ